MQKTHETLLNEVQSQSQKQKCDGLFIMKLFESHHLQQQKGSSAFSRIQNQLRNHRHAQAILLAAR
jgi:hypothetical protein